MPFPGAFTWWYLAVTGPLPSGGFDGGGGRQAPPQMPSSSGDGLGKPALVPFPRWFASFLLLARVGCDQGPQGGFQGPAKDQPSSLSASVGSLRAQTPGFCFIRVMICSVTIHRDAPGHGDFFKPVPRALDMSLLEHVLAHEMPPASSPRGPWCQAGNRWAQCPPWTPRTRACLSVCLRSNHESTPCGPSMPRHPDLCPRGPSPSPLRTGLCRLPPSPGSPPSWAAGNPFHKQRLPLVSPACFRVSRQPSGQ